MKSNKYDGYRSYQYLEAGKDYKTFEMAPEVGRVEPYRIEVSAPQEERAERLLNDSIVISFHDHPTLLPKSAGDVMEYKRQGREITGFEGLSVSGLDAVFENFMDGTSVITSHAGWKWDDVLYDMGMRYSDLAHQDYVIRAETVDDIVNAHATGRLALVPCIESLTPIENEVDRIDILYGFGVRLMGLVYSQHNMVGGGLAERHDGGLSGLGERAVQRLNKLGALIDVSHCGDRTSLEAIKLSKDPVVISHAGARSVWPIARMKTDEVLDELAARGGIIGIEAAPHTTISKDHRRHSIESIMDHFEYCVDRMGIDHVTFGPDTMFGDHVNIHIAFAEHFSASYKEEAPEFERVHYVAGMENPGECYHNIVRWLVKHNYSDDEIRKVIGDNILRVLRQVWV